MRQKCVRNASKWVLFYWETRNIPKCVRNASKMRQKCAEHLWGCMAFGRYRIWFGDARKKGHNSLARFCAFPRLHAGKHTRTHFACHFGRKTHTHTHTHHTHTHHTHAKMDTHTHTPVRMCNFAQKHTTPPSVCTPNVALGQFSALILLSLLVAGKINRIEISLSPSTLTPKPRKVSKFSAKRSLGPSQPQPPQK